MDDILKKHKDEQIPVLHMQRRVWIYINDYRHDSDLNTFLIYGMTVKTNQRVNCYLDELEFIPLLDPETPVKPGIMKQNILNTISDLCSSFLYYDRKEDEDLSAEQLNEAVASGVITIEEMVAEFRKHLENTFKAQ